MQRCAAASAFEAINHDAPATIARVREDLSVIMKLAFSNSACPELEFDTLVEKAREWGYAGVEIKYLDGQFDLTASPTLRRDPEMLKNRLAEHGQTLVALNTSLSFCDYDGKKLAGNIRKVRDTIHLAGRLGAKNVIVCGDVLSGISRSKAIEQTSAALRELAVDAAEHAVTLLIENFGDFASSRVMWTLHDAVRFPSVRICWNQIFADTLRERPSLTIPRLGKSIGLMHLTDARFAENGLIDSYAELGKGQLELVRMLELLKGMAYDGWLCVEWPRVWQPALAAADKVLPAAAKLLAGELAKKPVELSAYKGDKNAPKFVSHAPKEAGAPAADTKPAAAGESKPAAAPAK